VSKYDRSPSRTRLARPRTRHSRSRPARRAFGERDRVPESRSDPSGNLIPWTMGAALLIGKGEKGSIKQLHSRGTSEEWWVVGVLKRNFAPPEDFNVSFNKKRSLIPKVLLSFLFFSNTRAQGGEEEVTLYLRAFSHSNFSTRIRTISLRQTLPYDAIADLRDLQNARDAAALQIARNKYASSFERLEE